MARIAFIQNIAFEYLGVMYLSAVLKRHGHVVEMFIVSGDEDRALAEIAAFRPDIAGFPCTTGAHLWALKFASRLKKAAPVMTVFGGAHATYFPQVVEEEPVDAVCRGEGEYALLELAERLDRGEDILSVRNFWFKTKDGITRNEPRPLIEDLDELPFPDRTLYAGKYHFLNRSQRAFIGGRGCPFDCTFCFNHALIKLYQGKGKAVRYRSVDNLIAEINEVRSSTGLRTVYMQDDTFILNKKWFAEFASKYPKEVGLPFICLVRADLADEETIKGLKRAGCKNVFFGVETGSEDLRNSLLKKKVTDEEVINTGRLLKKYGIRFRTYNILGLPGETLEDAFRTVSINAEIETDYPWCALFYPFPGTELAEYAREKGLLDSSVDCANPSFFKESVLKSPHKNELINLQKLFFYGVKFPFLLPLIKRLIRLKPNIFFNLAFLASYGWCYLRSENLKPSEMISVGVRNVRGFFFANSGGGE
ncbi:MAG: radical SAM protein [Deltaproteobacteria bacterium]|nr:radical SAM protein [Deltaproteobacteria bacterium]MCL4873374.1 radical SAM protein [bacterium]